MRECGVKKRGKMEKGDRRRGRKCTRGKGKEEDGTEKLDILYSLERVGGPENKVQALCRMSTHGPFPQSPNPARYA